LLGELTLNLFEYFIAVNLDSFIRKDDFTENTSRVEGSENMKTSHFSFSTIGKTERLLLFMQLSYLLSTSTLALAVLVSIHKLHYYLVTLKSKASN